ncbi:MAG: hypothetical protein WC578_00975, partial [Candidatus Omnitrophota bacterium]
MTFSLVFFLPGIQTLMKAMRILIQFENKPLLFQKPKTGIISCYNPSAFGACFAEIEKALAAGYFVAGYFSYESGYCFEESLRMDKDYAFPLVYVGVYDSPIRGSLGTK